MVECSSWQSSLTKRPSSPTASRNIPAKTLTSTMKRAHHYTSNDRADCVIMREYYKRLTMGRGQFFGSVARSHKSAVEDTTHSYQAGTEVV